MSDETKKLQNLGVHIVTDTSAHGLKAGDIFVMPDTRIEYLNGVVVIDDYNMAAITRVYRHRGKIRFVVAQLDGHRLAVEVDPQKIIKVLRPEKAK